MDSGRVVAFRPFARVGVVASALAVAATLLLPNAAFADTGIGSALTNSGACGFPLDTIQITSAAPYSYAVPTGGGFITSWSTQVLNTNVVGLVGLEVWRPTATALSYQLVGASPLVMPPGPSGTVNSFTLATPIAVQAGDLIGLQVQGGMTCSQSSTNSGDTFGFAAGPTPAAGGTEAFISGSLARLNVAANVSTTAPTGGGGGGGSSGCDQSGAATGDNKCETHATCDTRVANHRQCVQQSGGDPKQASSGKDDKKQPAAKNTESKQSDGTKQTDSKKTDGKKRQG